MKNVLLIALLSVLMLNAHAQTSNNTKPEGTPNFYLGIGTGIDSYTGLLGLSGNLRVYDKLFVQGGLGLSSWGGKYSIGLKYDTSYGKGWSYGLGYSRCSGVKNLNINLETESGIKKDIAMDYLRSSTFNLKATRNWVIKNRNIFYIDLGYAFALQSNPWKITDGSVLSSSSKVALNMVAPGGVMLGLGFAFGL